MIATKTEWRARVLQLREQHGSTKALAKALGISYQIIDTWLRGEVDVERICARNYLAVMGPAAMPRLNAQSKVIPLNTRQLQIRRRVENILRSGREDLAQNLEWHVKTLEAVAADMKDQQGRRFHETRLSKIGPTRRP